MSMGVKRIFKMTALAAALAAAYGPALAAEGLVLEPNSVGIGIGGWSDDRFQRGMYDGMRDSGGYLLLDADILKRDDATGTWLGLKARNLGLDNREIKGEWLRQGDIGASLEFSSIRRDQPYVYNTGLQGIGTSTLRVPTPSITPGAGANVELHTTRDRLTAKFYKSLSPGLTFNLSIRNEDKDGTRHWGRGGAAEFAVEPINSNTQLVEGLLTYARGPLQLSGGYYGTYFNNSNTLITTSLTSGANIFYLSQPMDTKGHELFLNGGYNFTPTTRGTFKVSYSQVTQDEFLPTASIPGLASPLAPTSLDGRLDTTQLEVGLTAKPMPKLDVVANLRYRDFADKTPVRQYVFAGTPTWNTPFSYTNKTGKVEATYRLPQAYSLQGGIEYREQDRQVPLVGTLWVPFRQSMDEATYRVQLRKGMSETVNGSIAYVHAKRDGSAYRLPLNPADPEQDFINPWNISDRKRDKVRAMVDWSPTQQAALQFVVENSQDKYGGPNPYGLQKGTGRLYSVDGTYQIDPSWSVRAWFTRDENEADDVTQFNATTTKFNDLREKGDSFGVGVNGNAWGRMKVGGSIEQFRSVSKYQQTIVGTSTYPTGVVPASPPDITNTLLRLKLFAQYAVQKNSDVRVNLIHERFTTNDWAWTYFPATGPAPFIYGTTTDGTTVLAPQKQESTFLGVWYIIKFQ